MMGFLKPEDLRVLLEEALADFGVQRRMTVGGTAYYANGCAFAAARGGRLYLRLPMDEQDELRAEAVREGEREPQPDQLGMLPLPSCACDDLERLWAMVVRSFEQTLPTLRQEPVST